MTTFNKVTALFQDIGALVVYANMIDEAYCKAEGMRYVEFDETSEKFPTNLAGLYAADAAVTLLAGLSFGRDGISTARYMDALDGLARGTRGEFATLAGDICANLAWRQSQAYRGIERLKRPINKAFTALSPADIEKDRLQTKIGAQCLLKWLKSSPKAVVAA